MGQSSSQVEGEELPVEAGSMAPPPRRKRKVRSPASFAAGSTTASVQLARDLEDSVGKPRRDVDRPRKKRKKQRSEVEETQKQDANVIRPARAKPPQRLQEQFVDEHSPGTSLQPNDTAENPTEPSRLYRTQQLREEADLEKSIRTRKSTTKRLKRNKVALAEAIRQGKATELQARHEHLTSALSQARRVEEVSKVKLRLANAAYDEGSYTEGAYEKAAEALVQELDISIQDCPADNASGENNTISDQVEKSSPRKRNHRAAPPQGTASVLEEDPQQGNARDNVRKKRKRAPKNDPPVAKDCTVQTSKSRNIVRYENTANPDPAPPPNAAPVLEEDPEQGNPRDNVRKKRKRAPKNDPPVAEDSTVQMSKSQNIVKLENTADPDPRETDEQDSKALSRVASWLNSQEHSEAAESGEGDEVAVDDAGPNEVPDSSERKSQEQKNDDDDFCDVPSTTSGAFTNEERSICDRIYKEVQREHNFSDAQLNSLIKNWRNAGIFKVNVLAALSNRNKDSVRKFCQRTYHNMERGPWTLEQDTALRDAYAQWPDRWAKISDLVDRTAQDCKDRWNNHLHYDNMNIGPWSDEEEKALIGAVEECINAIKHEHRNDKVLLADRGRLETLIHWNTVVDKLEGHRTSKRCREKYAQLKVRELKESTAAANPSFSDSGNFQPESKHSPRKPVSTSLEQFELGDYYDAFVEIHTAFPDHNAHFPNETTLWSIVAVKSISRFSLAPKGAAPRKAALENALAEWPCDSKKIRRKLNNAKTIAAKAFVLAKWIEKQCNSQTEALPRTYRPDLVGKTAEEITELKRKDKVRRQHKQAKRTLKSLSKDYISDSNDEDEDDDQLRAADRDAAGNEDEQPEVPKSRTKRVKQVATREDPKDLAKIQRVEHHIPDSQDKEIPESEHGGSAAQSNDGGEMANPFAPPPRRLGTIFDERDEDSSADDSSDDESDRASNAVGAGFLASSMSSRYGGNRGETPSLSRKEFMKRCRTVGREQHAAFTARNGSHGGQN